MLDRIWGLERARRLSSLGFVVFKYPSIKGLLITVLNLPKTQHQIPDTNNRECVGLYVK